MWAEKNVSATTSYAGRKMKSVSEITPYVGGKREGVLASTPYMRGKREGVSPTTFYMSRKRESLGNHMLQYEDEKEEHLSKDTLYRCEKGRSRQARHARPRKCSFREIKSQTIGHAIRSRGPSSYAAPEIPTVASNIVRAMKCTHQMFQTIDHVILELSL